MAPSRPRTRRITWPCRSHYFTPLRLLNSYDGRADPGAWPRRRWDVALSFAGAQRDYVRQVADALKVREVRCFYDADEQVRLWGENLAEELPVFSDPMGDTVSSGPTRILFGTYVLVKCWAPNESGMGSINVFYLIESRP